MVSVCVPTVGLYKKNDDFFPCVVPIGCWFDCVDHAWISKQWKIWFNGLIVCSVWKHQQVLANLNFLSRRDCFGGHRGLNHDFWLSKNPSKGAWGHGLEKKIAWQRNFLWNNCLRTREQLMSQVRNSFVLCTQFPQRNWSRPHFFPAIGPWTSAPQDTVDTCSNRPSFAAISNVSAAALRSPSRSCEPNGALRELGFLGDVDIEWWI